MDKRKYKTNLVHDKYYTKKEISMLCIEKTLFLIGNNVEYFVEPSAGNGSFSDQIKSKECIAIDKYPKNDRIIKQDFFSFQSATNSEKTCCIGNPPFGRNSSLAVKFFNHAATMCKYIAFILPKTFRKQSVQNKLDCNFHLIFDEDIPSNSFIFENKSINVPCVFQIWEKKSYKRDIIILPIKSDLFEFASKSDCDFAIRRVGGSTGKVFLHVKSLSEESNYFIKCKTISITKLVKIVNSINFQTTINNTAGVRSLSKRELIHFIEEKYGF